MRIVEFACPGCGKSCKLNLQSKMLQHATPTCPVYERTKADGQLFIKMAKAAAAKVGKIVRTN